MWNIFYFIPYFKQTSKKEEVIEQPIIEPEAEIVEPIIEECAPIVISYDFHFRGANYCIGDKVRVSKHYNNFKGQYLSLDGSVFLNGEKPCVKLDLPANDPKREDETELDHWGIVEKL